MRGLFVQVGVGGMRGDFVEVAGDRADVPGDRPLVVVQHDDEFFRDMRDVVKRLVTDPAGECGVARDCDDMLVRARAVASHRHAQRGGERRARMARAVTVVLALAPEQEAVQAWYWRMVWNLSRRPVKILCTYPWWLTSKTNLSFGVSKTR